MSADQFEPAPEQGFPSNAEYPSNVDTSSAYSGNRPASGARRATPGEVLSQGFQGAENAGDFLGLDVEFTGSQPEGFGGPLDLVPPPGTYPQGEVEPSAPIPAPLPEGDAAQEFAQAPSAFEFGEDLGSEEGPIESEFTGAESTPRSRTPLVVGALVLAALGGAGYAFGPKLYSTYFGGAASVAHTPGEGGTKPEKVGKGESPAKGEPAKDGAIAALPSGSAPSGATPGESGSASSGATTPVPNVQPTTPRSGDGFGSETSQEPTFASVPETSPVTPSDVPTDDAVVASSTAPRSASAFPDIAGAEFNWAGENQLEVVWRGSDVPLEAVRAPARTLMPKVGQVRVFTTAGDVFDGRLYAVGQNRVWVDAAPGRIGLDGDLIERIEVLPPLSPGQNPQEGAPVAGGKQVRARVPGGMLYGRILKSSGDDVMLVLDDGGKVLVKSSDLEDIGSGRAVVVRR